MLTRNRGERTSIALTRRVDAAAVTTRAASKRTTSQLPSAATPLPYNRRGEKIQMNLKLAQSFADTLASATDNTPVQLKVPVHGEVMGQDDTDDSADPPELMPEVTAGTVASSSAGGLEPELCELQPTSTLSSTSYLPSDYVHKRPSSMTSFPYRYFYGWPLYAETAATFGDACEIILGLTAVDPARVCDDVPRGYKDDGTFVISLAQFADPYDDIRHDGLGNWGPAISCGRNRFYKVDNNGEMVRKECRTDDDFDIQIVCKRYDHPSANKAFWKKIYVGVRGKFTDADASPPSPLLLAVVTYEWREAKFDFQCDTTPSTKEARRAALLTPAPVSKQWEKESRSTANDADNQQTMHFAGCPLYMNGAISFNEACQIIMGSVAIDSDKICTRVPHGFRSQGTFIIDLGVVRAVRDLRKDGNGFWGQPSGVSRFYQVDAETGDASRVDRKQKVLEGAAPNLQILQKRYENPATGKRFVRKIYIGRKPHDVRTVESCCDLAVITYFWKGTPQDFEPITNRNTRTSWSKRRRMNDFGDAASGVEFQDNYDDEDDDEEPPRNVLQELGEVEDAEESDNGILDIESSSTTPADSHRRHVVKQMRSPKCAPMSAISTRQEADNVRLEVERMRLRSEKMRQTLIQRQFDVMDRFMQVIDRADQTLQRYEQDQLDAAHPPNLGPVHCTPSPSAVGTLQHGHHRPSMHNSHPPQPHNRYYPSFSAAAIDDDDGTTIAQDGGIVVDADGNEYVPITVATSAATAGQHDNEDYIAYVEEDVQHVAIY